MLCSHPVSVYTKIYPCGRCDACRRRRRRLWSHRIALEALQHKCNAFVTLTYNDDKLPRLSSGLATLEPTHPTLFLKKLRRRHEPEQLRYFMAAEYGSLTERPHYHFALFNFPTCSFGRSRYNKLRMQCCATCEGVREIWGFGNVLLGTLEEKSAEYLARYVVKGMTRDSDPRLDGRCPEFARMSLKPGIGASAMDDVASETMRWKLLERGHVDVVGGLGYGRSVRPIGRYLRGNLRVKCGLPKTAPEAVVEKYEMELLQLLEDTKKDKDGISLSEASLRKWKGRLDGEAARAKIYKQRDVL